MREPTAVNIRFKLNECTNEMVLEAHCLHTHTVDDCALDMR